MRLTTTEIETPVGVLALVASPGGAGVCALGFADGDAWSAVGRGLRRRFGRFELVAGELVAGAVDAAARVRGYLDGDLRALDGVRVDAGGTPFQRAVWQALRTIPPGVTVSYGELAAALGRPTAVRAVARANALNPVALVVPCHRVIGHDGGLTGYAYGLARKSWLLALERRHAALPSDTAFALSGKSRV